MPVLQTPTAVAHRSFLEALDEFRAEGRLGRDDSTGLAQEFRDGIPAADDPEAVERWIATLRARALPETPRPRGFVPDTLLWFTDGDAFIGRLSLRHELNEMLLEVGGHVGYDVRPSARRRGHATEMLRRALPVAHGLGIHSALVTCDIANIASRRVIEANGGVLEDVRYGKLRFWVPTAPE